MDTLQAIIIAIVEGLTECPPISSTAHMGSAASLVGIPEDEYLKVFQVSIQFGAILLIVMLYWRKFSDFSNSNLYIKSVCAVVPALVLGELFDDKIEAVLGNQKIIPIVLIIGGITLIFVDKWFKNPTIDNKREISVKEAVVVGFWRCLMMMPDTSCSVVSTIGGMAQGPSREAAAKFSFFSTAPTMSAVTVYLLFLKKWGAKDTVQQKGYKLIIADDQSFWLFIMGNAVAFVVAMIAVKFFIHVLTRFGFEVWGIYRIIVGSVLLHYS